MQVGLPYLAAKHNRLDRVPGKHPWVYRASVAQIVTVAVAFGLLVWVLVSGFALLLTIYPQLMAIPTATVDALVAIGLGGLLMKLMLAQRLRHRRLVRQLKTISEMNHHIRNALEEIELTAHASQNDQFVKDVKGATTRIQWALREVLPAEEDDEE